MRSGDFEGPARRAGRTAGSDLNIDLYAAPPNRPYRSGRCTEHHRLRSRRIAVWHGIATGGGRWNDCRRYELERRAAASGAGGNGVSTTGDVTGIGARGIVTSSNGEESRSTTAGGTPSSVFTWRLSRS